MFTWVVEFDANKYLIIGVFAVQVAHVLNDSCVAALHQDPVPHLDADPEGVLLHLGPLGCVCEDIVAVRTGTAQGVEGFPRLKIKLDERGRILNPLIGMPYILPCIPNHLDSYYPLSTLV